MIPASALAPLLPLARWSLAWLGWLWLGQQGLRAGGAGGVALVALWWALQSLLPVAALRGPAWAWTLGAAAAVVGSEWLAGQAAWMCLWVSAACWALACARIRAVRLCRHENLAGRWAPAGGAALAGLAVLGPAGTVAVAGLLAACAGVLACVPAQGAPRRPPSGVDSLAGMSMGLMMGSAWLSADLCRVAGGSPSVILAVHMAAMGLAPALLADPLRRLGPSARLLLLGAGGAWALLDPTPGGWALAMGMQALAWAAGAGLHPGGVSPSTRAPGIRTGFLAAAGPVLLLAAGLGVAQGAGPSALAWAHAAVGALALGRLWWASGRGGPVGAAG